LKGPASAAVAAFKHNSRRSVEKVGLVAVSALLPRIVILAFRSQRRVTVGEERRDKR
jgi:hypothetical protein